MISAAHPTAHGTVRTSFVGSDAKYQADTFELQYQKLLADIPEICQLAYCQQVHGNRLLPFISGNGIQALGEADALYTREAQVALLVRTADCMPILVYHTKKPFVAAVHAGWRGLEQKILSKLLEQEVKKDERIDLRFVIGPFIAQESYEVGHEVAQSFTAACSEPKHNGKFMLNLRSILEAEFELLGILPEQTTWHADDTRTNSAWYSARGGSVQRNLAFVYRY